jgi:putative acetyltransferase
MEQIEIISYTHEYQPDFYRLNLAWLDKYNLTESHDLVVMNDPEGTIINNGGYIWLAKAGNNIVGTAAIVNEGNNVYELAKMAVDENYQGRGISKLLIEACINKAKEINATKLELFSNHQLTTALGLYEKYGFHQVEVTHSPFATADVKMELKF